MTLPSTEQLSAEAIEHRLETMIDHLTSLARGETTEAEYAQTLTQGCVDAGVGLVATLWKRALPSPLARTSNLPQQVVERLSESMPVPSEQVFRSTDVSTTSFRCSTQSEPPGASDLQPAGMLRMFGPVVVEGDVMAIVEIAFDEQVSEHQQHNCSEVLKALCEISTEFYSLQWLRELQQRDSQLKAWEDFVSQAHSQLDLTTAAYTIANEAVNLIGCDRVVVAVGPPDRIRLQAISGLASFDRRAEAVRCLQQLIDRIAMMGQSIWYNGRTEDLPPEIGTSLERYVDEAHLRSVVAIPLLTKDSQVGASDWASVLVFEWFHKVSWEERDREQLTRVGRQSQLALANAATYSAVPLIGWLQRLAVLRRPPRLAAIVLGAVAIVGLCGVLIGVQADFTITCRGELQPATHRHVFAPTDGQIEWLAVHHGSLVDQQQVLARLRSDTLEYERTRVLGEIQTASEQLSTLEASRRTLVPATAAEREQYAQQTAEEERLKKLVENLKTQKQLLDEQQAKLEILSPIAGQVLDWDVEQTLVQRPVQQGQQLLTIADTASDWCLELRVPEKYVGYVLEAQQASEQPLPVSFFLNTAPGERYAGQLKQVAMRAELDAWNELSVQTTVAFDASQVASLRPGAGAVARIECGQRSLGFVWLHDTIALIRRWLFI